MNGHELWKRYTSVVGRNQYQAQGVANIAHDCIVDICEELRRLNTRLEDLEQGQRKEASVKSRGELRAELNAAELGLESSRGVIDGLRKALDSTREILGADINESTPDAAKRVVEERGKAKQKEANLRARTDAQNARILELEELLSNEEHDKEVMMAERNEALGELELMCVEARRLREQLRDSVAVEKAGVLETVKEWQLPTLPTDHSKACYGCAHTGDHSHCLPCESVKGEPPTGHSTRVKP